jgi:hypothetical protein
LLGPLEAKGQSIVVAGTESIIFTAMGTRQGAGQPAERIERAALCLNFLRGIPNDKLSPYKVRQMVQENQSGGNLLLDVLRQVVEQEDMLTFHEAKKQFGRKRQALTVAVKESKLLQLHYGTRLLLYPMFQFTEDGKLFGIVGEINVAIEAFANPWRAVHFWFTPNGLISGMKPADLVGTPDEDKLRELATAYLGQPVDSVLEIEPSDEPEVQEYLASVSETPMPPSDHGDGIPDEVDA